MLNRFCLTFQLRFQEVERSFTDKAWSSGSLRCPVRDRRRRDFDFDPSNYPYCKSVSTQPSHKLQHCIHRSSSHQPSLLYWGNSLLHSRNETFALRSRYEGNDFWSFVAPPKSRNIWRLHVWRFRSTGFRSLLCRVKCGFNSCRGRDLFSAPAHKRFRLSHCSTENNLTARPSLTRRDSEFHQVEAAEWK